MEWYSTNKWVDESKEKFLAKLDHTPKSSRIQCLKILASELIRTQDEENIDFAENLLAKVWKEDPDQNFAKVYAVNSLEENNQLRSKLKMAIKSYRKSVSNKKTNAVEELQLSLDYAQMIIELNEIDEYNDVIKLLKPLMTESLSPIFKYKISSILSLIYASKKDMRQLRYYKKIAKENVSPEYIGLQSHKLLRAVKSNVG